ncbi:hypothetical protein V6N12_028164 [Hibiscus sabdariffa]|uniref:Uncharacterized protein n=1 Tax=Hibiscus sabdariffa TaxID=183260 RepID=A0ABR2F514_9ROSI
MLPSDQVLVTDDYQTRQLILSYAKDPQAFFEDFQEFDAENAKFSSSARPAPPRRAPVTLSVREMMSATSVVVDDAKVQIPLSHKCSQIY